MALVNNQEPSALSCKLRSKLTCTVKHCHRNDRVFQTPQATADEIDITVLNPQLVLECYSPLVHQCHCRYDYEDLRIGMSLPDSNHALHGEERLPRASHDTYHTSKP